MSFRTAKQMVAWIFEHCVSGSITWSEIWCVEVFTQLLSVGFNYNRTRRTQTPKSVSTRQLNSQTRLCYSVVLRVGYVCRHYYKIQWNAAQRQLYLIPFLSKLQLYKHVLDHSFDFHKNQSIIGLDAYGQKTWVKYSATFALWASQSDDIMHPTIQF